MVSDMSGMLARAPPQTDSAFGTWASSDFELQSASVEPPPKTSKVFRGVPDLVPATVYPPSPLCHSMSVCGSGKER